MVRIELIRRGWSGAYLGQLVGLSARSFETQLSGSFPAIAVRAKIEAAFSYTVPLWSSAKTLQARKFCLDNFGADPALLALPALRQLAERVRLPGWEVHAKKQDLLTAVLTHLTAMKARHVSTKKNDNQDQDEESSTTEIK